MLLAQKVENDDRQDAQHDQGHGGAHINGAVAALQVLDVDGDRHIQVAVQYQIRQQEVVPDPHDLQNAHGDQSGLQHGQHYHEEGAQGAAAVDGGGLFDLDGDGLHKAHEHKDRKPGAEPQVDDGNGPGGVQADLLQAAGEEVVVRDLNAVRRAGQSEHDHLEGHHHGEYTQVVDHLAEETAHPGDVPGRHGAADQDQGRGGQGHEKAVEHRFGKGIVAEGHALDVVLKAHEGLAVGQGEGVHIHGAVAFEGVDEHQHHGHDVDDADDGERHRQGVLCPLLLL